MSSRTHFSAPLLPVLLLLLLPAACDSSSSGGSGNYVPWGGGQDVTGAGVSFDYDLSALPDGVGGQTGIANLQNHPQGLVCDDHSGVLLESVGISGAVVASARFSVSDALDAYFIADPKGGPYSGIQLVVPKEQWADLKLGDTVQVTGSLEEFHCMTQIKALNVIVVAGQAPPEAAALTVADLVDAARAEPYESVLVKVSNVVATEGPNDYGEFKLEGGLMVDDLLMKGEVELPLNSTIESVTGFVSFSFGQYKLAPRSAADLVFRGGLPKDAGGIGADTAAGRDGALSDDGVPPADASGDPGSAADIPPTTTTIADIQQGEGSIGCTDQPGAVDTIRNVIIEEATVISPKYTVNPKEQDPAKILDGYFVAEAGGVYEAINLIVNRAAGADFAPGDVVRIEGDAEEFFCNSQLKGHNVTRISSGATPPAPIQIEGALLTSPNTAEPYEGTLVRLSNVVATEGPTEYGEYILDGGVIVDNLFLREDLDLPLSTTIPSITGVVTYSYERYRVQPRTVEDISR